MATAVWLQASFPGCHTAEGLIIGNPEAVANIDSGAIPAGSYPVSPQMTLTAAARKRLLTIVTTLEIDVLQVYTNQTSATPTGSATRVPAPSSGLTAYACYLDPATVGVYVRTP